jgi:hypothetical protein
LLSFSQHSTRSNRLRSRSARATRSLAIGQAARLPANQSHAPHIDLADRPPLDPAPPARLIPIQQQQHTTKPIAQQLRRMLVEFRSQKRHYAYKSRLAHTQTVEKSFHQEGCVTAGRCRPMIVEQDLRFPKARRKTVRRLSAIYRPARIGHQAATLVVNRNHHSSAH